MNSPEDDARWQLERATKMLEDLERHARKRLSLRQLAAEVEKQFLSTFGSEFTTSAGEILFESSSRGGFRIELVDGTRHLTLHYGDFEFEVAIDGRELFGDEIHNEFEGNMFSRANLLSHLPTIAASAFAQLKAGD